LSDSDADDADADADDADTDADDADIDADEDEDEDEDDWLGRRSIIIMPPPPPPPPIRSASELQDALAPMLVRYCGTTGLLAIYLAIAGSRPSGIIRSM
jgi:hypothetical protein